MDAAVKRYMQRRDARLLKRGFRKDDEENNNNKKPVSHGNTKLPFGLCQRYGIEIGKGWTPKDAWDALAGKGVTPSGEFAKLKGEKKTLKSRGTEYSNLKGEKDGKMYMLRGDFDAPVLGGGTRKSTGAHIGSFINRDEMMAYLQEKGVTSFVDPDTGKKVNPVKMELPKTVATDGFRRYTDVIIGTNRGYPHTYDRPGFTITGKNFNGEKVRLKSFTNESDARKYAEKIMRNIADLRESRDYKKYLERKTA